MNPRTSFAALCALVLGVGFFQARSANGAASAALPAPAPRSVDFVTDIQPILARRCLECHGPQKQKSAYRLDNQPIAFRGGDSGHAAIVPGNSAGSPLIRSVTSSDRDERMPPKGDPLTADEVGLLRAWIDQGATWPESASARVDDPRDWWSLQPLRRPTVPKVLGLENGENPIDAFVRARLLGSGGGASAEADRRTLIRRVTFDLTGLPPTPEEVAAFLADKDPRAYERLVDRLLSSPHYGERWARTWLDIVHYGDTQGYDKDKPRLNAWPYRDYVIRAFNEDKRYSRFVQEQIAGDVLFPDTADGIEALGFISAGPWDFIGHEEVPETKTDGRIARHLDRDDMVSNTIGTFASLTVHCAQCHDHKFDPIRQEDYYALQSVFAAVDRTERRYYRDEEMTRARSGREAGIRAITRRERELNDEVKRIGGDALKQADAKIAGAPSAAGELDRLRAAREDLITSVVPAGIRTALADTIAASKSANKALDAMPKPLVVFVGSVHHGSGNFRGTGPDDGRPRPIFVLARGDVNKPGAKAVPAALRCVSEVPSAFGLPDDAPEGQRRAALAAWLTNPENPLTWRSIVNRVWQQRFGRGIVETPNDFGKMGGRPSHRDLLDWLALEFRDGGQSFKTLDRLIVLSATYRQVSTPAGKSGIEDGDNRLLGHMNRRRLDAEGVRDTVLSVSGQLDRMMYGPGFQDFVVEKPEHSPHYQYHLHDPEDPKAHRRSVYRFLVRSQQEPFMSALDCADPSMRVDRRNETLTPLQALAMLNSSLTVAMARHFAERVEHEAGTGPEACVDRAFSLATQRAPTPSERAELMGYARQHGLTAMCRLLMNLNEFVYVD